MPALRKEALRLPEPSSELEAAVAAERQRKESQQAADRQARDQSAREFEAAGARIFDALRDALASHPGSPAFDAVVTKRMVPASSTTVKRGWPLPPKVVVEAEHEVEERSTVEVGRCWSVTVETRSPDPTNRWREAYPNEYRMSYRFSFSMTVRNDGEMKFEPCLEQYKVINSWSDQVGGEHHEREWVTMAGGSFLTRESWLNACRSDSDPACSPDSRMADEIVAQIARQLA